MISTEAVHDVSHVVADSTNAGGVVCNGGHYLSYLDAGCASARRSATIFICFCPVLCASQYVNQFLEVVLV